MLSFMRSQEKKPRIIFIKFSERLMPRIGFLEQATTCDSCLIFSQPQVALQIPKDAETIGDVLTFVQTKYRIGGIITLSLAKTVFPPELPVEALEIGISRGQVFTLEPLRASRFNEDLGCKVRLSINCCSFSEQVGDESQESDLQTARGVGDDETETAGRGEDSENGEDDLAEHDVGSENGGDSAEGDSEELHVDEEDDGMREDSDKDVEDDPAVLDADNEDSGRDSVSAEDESTEVEADDDYDERAEDVSGLHEQRKSLEGRDEVDMIEDEGAAPADNGDDISSGYDGGIESNEEYRSVVESTIIMKTGNSEASAEATTQPFGAELSMTLNVEGATVESNEASDVVDPSINEATDVSAAINDQPAEDESAKVETDDKFEEEYKRAEDASSLHEQSKGLGERDELGTAENQDAGLHDTFTGNDGGSESIEEPGVLVIVLDDGMADEEGELVEDKTEPLGTELGTTLPPDSPGHDAVGLKSSKTPMDSLKRRNREKEVGAEENLKRRKTQQQNPSCARVARATEAEPGDVLRGGVIVRRNHVRAWNSRTDKTMNERICTVRTENGNECGKRLPNGRCLVNHHRLTHGIGPQYLCARCGYSHHRKDVVDSHIRNRHTTK